MHHAHPPTPPNRTRGPAAPRLRLASRPALAGVALAGLALTGLAGCPSPVEDAIIEAQGPEVNGVEEGELHRYGQACVACHGDYLGVEPILVIAGTVFATPVDEVTVEGARVELTDATGSKIVATTNCAGNFHVEQGEWDPVFPLRAVVECTLPDGRVRRNVMGTRINREGSCAACHADEAPSQLGPGRVYCTDEVLEQPFALVPGCEGGPGALP